MSQVREAWFVGTIQQFERDSEGLWARCSGRDRQRLRPCHGFGLGPEDSCNSKDWISI